MADCHFCAPPDEELECGDPHFRVTHAPLDRARPGTLIVATRRHVLDFGDLSGEEAAGFGALLRSLYPAVRAATGAERVHIVATMDFVPHFHVWVVPRAAAEPLRGIPYLVSPAACTRQDATAALERIGAQLA